MVKDVVCGTEIEEPAAEEAGLATEYEGKTYYFCGAKCKARFDHAPVAFAEPTIEEQREDDDGGQAYYGT